MRAGAFDTYCKKFCRHVCMDGFLYFSSGPGSIPLFYGYLYLIHSQLIYSSFWQLGNEIEMCFRFKTPFDVPTTGTELNEYLCHNGDH